MTVAHILISILMQLLSLVQFVIVIGNIICNFNASSKIAISYDMMLLCHPSTTSFTKIINNKEVR